MADERDLANCDREITEIDRLLRAGHADIEGLVLGLKDWSHEKRLIEAELQEQAIDDAA